MNLLVSKMNSVNRFIQLKNERFGNNKLLSMDVRKFPLPPGLICNEHEVKIVHYVEIDLMGCQKNLRMLENKGKQILLALKYFHG